MPEHELIIRIAGDGGDGVISAGDIVARACARLGLAIFTFKTFPAEARGGYAMHQLRTGIEKIHNHGDNPNVLCAELIKGGLEHKGFAYVHIISQCPAFNKEETVKYLRSIIRPVPEDHDVADADAARQLLDEFGEKQPVGLIYRTERPTLDEHMAEIVKKAGGSEDYDIRKIIELSRP